MRRMAGKLIMSKESKWEKAPQGKGWRLDTGKKDKAGNPVYQYSDTKPGDEEKTPEKKPSEKMEKTKEKVKEVLKKKEEKKVDLSNNKNWDAVSDMGVGSDEDFDKAMKSLGLETADDLKGLHKQLKNHVEEALTDFEDELTELMDADSENSATIPDLKGPAVKDARKVLDDLRKRSDEGEYSGDQENSVDEFIEKYEGEDTLDEAETFEEAMKNLDKRIKKMGEKEKEDKGKKEEEEAAAVEEKKKKIESEVKSIEDEASKLYDKGRKEVAEKWQQGGNPLHPNNIKDIKKRLDEKHGGDWDKMMEKEPKVLEYSRSKIKNEDDLNEAMKDVEKAMKPSSDKYDEAEAKKKEVDKLEGGSKKSSSRRASRGDLIVAKITNRIVTAYGLRDVDVGDMVKLEGKRGTYEVVGKQVEYYMENTRTGEKRQWPHDWTEARKVLDFNDKVVVNLPGRMGDTYGKDDVWEVLFPHIKYSMKSPRGKVLHNVDPASWTILPVDARNVDKDGFSAAERAMEKYEPGTLVVIDFTRTTKESLGKVKGITKKGQIKVEIYSGARKWDDQETFVPDMKDKRDTKMFRPHLFRGEWTWDSGSEYIKKPYERGKKLTWLLD